MIEVELDTKKKRNCAKDEEEEDEEDTITTHLNLIIKIVTCKQIWDVYPSFSNQRKLNIFT